MSDSKLDPLVRKRLAEQIKKDIENIGCIYGTIGAVLWDEPVERLVCRILKSVEETVPNNILSSSEKNAAE